MSIPNKDSYSKDEKGNNIDDSFDKMDANGYNQNEDNQSKESGLLEQSDEEKLMNSRTEIDKSEINLEDAALSEELSSNNFIPDLFFEKMINNFRSTKKDLGQKILREISGYDTDYLEQNLVFKEFQEEVKKNINKKTNQLQSDGLIDKNFNVTEKALIALKIDLINKESQKIKNHIGSQKRKTSKYGEVSEFDNFKNHSFKDISVRKSLKTAIKRGHNSVKPTDMKATIRKNSQKKDILLVVDSSVSMKDKLDIVKRVGASLILSNKSKDNFLGFIEFNNEIKRRIPLGKNFDLILDELVKIKTEKETNIFKALEEIDHQFRKSDHEKVVVMVTDFIPTLGEKEILINKFTQLTKKKIKFYLIGIDLDSKGKELSKELLQINRGKLFLVQKDNKNVDLLISEEFA